MGLFNVEETMVSVLHKELGYKEENKAQVQELWGHAAEDQNQVQTSSGIYYY